MKSFIALLFIAVSVTVFFVMVKPKYQSLQDLRTSVAAANANLDTAAKLTKSRDELIARYQKISKADLDNLKTLLPDSVNNIRLIIQINSLATKNNLSLLRSVDYQTDEALASKNQDPQAAVKPYGEFTLSFQTTGQYKNFLAFISDLEQNLRLVDVVKVDFTPADQGVQSTGTSFSYRVTLQTYWLKQ